MGLQVGLFYILSDLVVVLHDLGEGLPDHVGVPDRPILFHLEKVPIAGFLVVNQRHKHKLFFRFTSVFLIWTSMWVTTSSVTWLMLKSSATDPPDSRKLVPTFQKIKHWQLHSVAIMAVIHIALSAYAPPSRTSTNSMWTV